MNIKLMNQFELIKGLPKFRKGCDICNEDKATERFYGACGGFIWICGSCYKKIQNKRDSKKEEGKYWKEFKTLSDDGKAILNAIGVEKEFNLSEKVVDMSNPVWSHEKRSYNEKDVKEFIKKWIQSLIPDDKPIDCINKLKKLAGDKLI